MAVRVENITSIIDIRIVAQRLSAYGVVHSVGIGRIRVMAIVRAKRARQLITLCPDSLQVSVMYSYNKIPISIDIYYLSLSHESYECLLHRSLPFPF